MVLEDKINIIKTIGVKVENELLLFAKILFGRAVCGLF